MVRLGDEVIDTVSGFKGIVVSNTEYLQGCNRMSVQPRVKKNGELPGSKAFDEPQLKLVKSKKVKRGKGRPGGVAYAQPSEKNNMSR